jgi:FKBP-type peptidyl-prolyl cis-trans isomerase 2
MVLDRDDRGGLNNSIVVNGKRIASPIRQETVSIRGIVAGEYTVNVNHYLATTGQPVPVSVKVEKVNPQVEVVHYDTFMLDHTGHEKTAVRFRIADSGNVLEVNSREKSLIQLTRAVRRSPK